MCVQMLSEKVLNVEGPSSLDLSPDRCSSRGVWPTMRLVARKSTPPGSVHVEPLALATRLSRPRRPSQIHSSTIEAPEHPEGRAFLLGQRLASNTVVVCIQPVDVVPNLGEAVVEASLSFRLSIEVTTVVYVP